MCHKLATYDLDSFWAGINGYLASPEFLLPLSLLFNFVNSGNHKQKKIQVSYDFNISYITSQKKKMKNFHKRYGSETGNVKIFRCQRCNL